MTQEQFNPLDQISESATAAGAAIADALAAMNAQVNEVRGAQEPQINAAGSADNDKLVQGELPRLQIDKVENRLDRLLEIENKVPEAQLSSTERLMVSALSGAANRSDINGVEEALQAILENPKSQDRVMREVAQEIEKAMPGVSAGWETGTNHRGEPFLRLKLEAATSKSGPFTDLTIGTDGRAHGSHTPFREYDRPAQPLTGEQAFRMLRDPRSGIPERNPNLKPNSLDVPAKPVKPLPPVDTYDRSMNK